MELGQIEKVRKLQEMNIKVFSLLNIPIDEIPKAKSPQPRHKIEEPLSSMFDLTGGD